MKLLNKTSIYYLLLTLPIFAICSVGLYYIISAQIRENLDESFVNEKIKIQQVLNSELKSLYFADTEVHLTIFSGKQTPYLNQYTDTMIYSPADKEMIPYRIFRTFVHDKNNMYALTINKSYIESDDLIMGIIEAVLMMFVFLLIGFQLINRWISKKLWQPFNQTLEILSNYDIDNANQIQFEMSHILEFNEMNKALTKMTQKIYDDYISQKQFVENASHELQTPLAIIKSKIELLIQSTNISKNEMELIQSLYNATNKMSQMNKALLLLTRIENRQFSEVENVDISNLVEKNLEQYEDFLTQKEITINKKIISGVKIKINPTLCDILISNLLLNAIKHNVLNGKIDIELESNKLILANTGQQLSVNPSELFDRFKKNQPSTDSLGLGLSIVKKICQSFGIKIQYLYADGWHRFVINFN